FVTAEQLMLSADETVLVAKDIFTRALAVEEIVDTDRAFIQRVLLIAVDASEKAGTLCDLYTSAFKGVASQSVKQIVTSFAKKVPKRWFKLICDGALSSTAKPKVAIFLHMGGGTDLQQWPRMGLRSDVEIKLRHLEAAT